MIDLSLPRKAIHEARQIRNSEAVSPGIVRHTRDQQLAQGRALSERAVRSGSAGKTMADRHLDRWTHGRARRVQGRQPLLLMIAIYGYMQSRRERRRGSRSAIYSLKDRSQPSLGTRTTETLT